MHKYILTILISAFLISSVSSEDNVDFSGDWDGFYECDQVRWKTQFSISSSYNGAVSGQFTFFDNEEPLTFIVSGATSGDRLAILPGEWVTHNKNYKALGFVAELENNVLTGTISHPRCGIIAAQKSK